MILHTLQEYYYRKLADPTSDIAPYGWERRSIPFLAVLDQNGTFKGFEDTRDGKKKSAKKILVPIATKKTNQIAPNLLWGPVDYVFGVSLKKNRKRTEDKRTAFIERIKKDMSGVASVQPILKLLKSITCEQLEEDELWEDIVEKNHVVSFKFEDENGLIFDHQDVKEAVENIKSKGSRGICLITGEESSISSLHIPIKELYGAQPSGAKIVSFNWPAFCSDSKKQGYNAPIGEKTAFAYATALNYLLRYESDQKLIIGDTTMTFWSEQKTDFESDFASIFSDPPKDDPDSNTRAVRNLFKSIENGKYLKNEGKTNFYVLGLGPAGSRISIRLWLHGTVTEFSKNIKQHFEDLSIKKKPGEQEYPSLKELLANTAVKNKYDNISPKLPGEMIQAILRGTSYPMTLLQRTLRRIKSDPKDRVNSGRAALVKAFLNRFYRVFPNSNYKELLMVLDKSHPSRAYHLGRLFASLEKIQEDAHGRDATIREKFYAAACSRPVSAFSRLMKLKNYHLRKIRRIDLQKSHENTLMEIMTHVDDFPSYHNPHEQGLFAVGYYHQRQQFYTKKKGKGGDSGDPQVETDR